MKIKEALSFNDVLLVPKRSSISSRDKVDLSTCIAGLELDIPIIAANMSFCEEEMLLAMAKRGGLGILHRMMDFDDQLNMLSRVRSKLETGQYIGASVGIGDDAIEKAKELIDYVDIICFDVAHFHHKKALDVLRKWSRAFPDYPTIVGNVATEEAVVEILNEWKNNANTENLAIKCGIGGGSVCTTRIKTGCGVPTLQTILSASPYSYEVDIIADGGHNESGDCIKSLAAGASAVMLGSMLAGTKESAGEIIKDGKSGNKYKIYKGNASFSSKNKVGLKTKYIEGVETLVPYKGSVHDVLDDICYGIKSGFSYCNAGFLEELWQLAEFIKISSAGYRESLPHGAL